MSDVGRPKKRRRKSSLGIQTIRDNIKVAVRCRPVLPHDDTQRCKCSIDAAENSIEITEMNGSHKNKNSDLVRTPKKYTFDQVYHQQSRQDSVFQTSIAPILEDVLLGFNCTVFAYGQTGTGKTFTMEGDVEGMATSDEISESAGVISRSVHHIFEKITHLKKCESTVSVSHLEIYNEELCDLLNGDDGTKLSIVSESGCNKRTVVKGLSEVVVRSAHDIFQILHKSLKRRKTAATRLNKVSSRSHCIFTITVRMKEIEICAAEDYVKIGTLNLVDLAGSECIKRSGAKNVRAREAKNINRSLLTLGMVISALVERKQHIPYRDSKLTRLLQESLGGRNKTLLIATIGESSSIANVLNTLCYAHQAKKIQNKPEVNEKTTQKQEIQRLMIIINKYKRDLAASRTKKGIWIDKDNYKEMKAQLKANKEELSQLETELENEREGHDVINQTNDKKLNKLKDELKRCREENQKNISKYNKLDQNYKELKEGFKQLASDRDQIQAKLISLETLNQENQKNVSNKCNLSHHEKNAFLEMIQNTCAKDTNLINNVKLNVDKSRENIIKISNASNNIQTVVENIIINSSKHIGINQIETKKIYEEMDKEAEISQNEFNEGITISQNEFNEKQKNFQNEWNEKQKSDQIEWNEKMSLIRQQYTENLQTKINKFNSKCKTKRENIAKIRQDSFAKTKMETESIQNAGNEIKKVSKTTSEITHLVDNEILQSQTELLNQFSNDVEARNCSHQEQVKNMSEIVGGINTAFKHYVPTGDTPQKKKLINAPIHSPIVHSKRESMGTLLKVSPVVSKSQLSQTSIKGKLKDKNKEKIKEKRKPMTPREKNSARKNNKKQQKPKSNNRRKKRDRPDSESGDSEENWQRRKRVRTS